MSSSARSLIASESQVQFGASHATGDVAVDLDGELDCPEFHAQYRVLPSWGSTIDSKVKPSVERLERFMRGIIKVDCRAFKTRDILMTLCREFDI